MISDDYKAVLEILKDASVLEKVEPYKYKAYLESSYAYRLVTYEFEEGDMFMGWSI